MRLQLLPLWLAWSLHCYWLGQCDQRRVAWLIGLAAWLLGLGLGWLAGGT